VTTEPSLAAPSDKIQFGFIGVGRQGTSRLNEFIRHPDVVAAAVCDLVCQYYSERLLAPKVRFFIEEIVEEIRP